MEGRNTGFPMRIGSSQVSTSVAHEAWAFQTREESLLYERGPAPDAMDLSDEAEDALEEYLAQVLTAAGFRLVSGGTDNHLMLVDVFSRGLTGKVAEAALGRAGITVNKNAIPFDQNPPMTASGIRVGTPAVTSRGMREAEMEIIGELIVRTLQTPDDGAALGMIRAEVERLCRKFPLYPV